MSKRKTALGIAVLFALALSAFAAPGASAATSGTTAFTCVKGKGVLNGAHCLGTSGGEYGHVAIKQDETTTGTATNEETAANAGGESTKAAKSATLKGALAGVETELTCAEVHGEGTFENKLEGEVHYATAEGKLHYTKCEVKKPNKKCKVKGETVTTEQLFGSTKGQGMAAKIEPKVGTKFADITIEGCEIESLNNTFPVSGSLVAQISGATLTATHAEITTQNTLKFGGVKAGLEGALTLKAHKVPKEGEGTEETKPLSATTVE